MVIDEPVLHLASAAGLALLLGSAGVHKLRHWREFSVIFGDYNAALGSLLPAWIAGLLPVLELLAAGAVLASPWQPDAALPAVFLFGLYVAVLAVAARRGSSIADCGCHFSGRSQPPGRALVLRNLLLLLPALNLLSPMGNRSLTWFDGVTLIFVLAGSVALYALAHLLISNRAVVGERT
ncbi:MauE/DoxX family redox-associated membrane protein [Pseudomonas citronellolis]|uniref:MauE/DoxX family redox-associated membrane protein n=1 Tax=Pseudomonas citronellolis TaxID=53408 RepID=UPI0021C22EBC|nr:MauE/DoxX family redox-associated membrane protein [Pseudomonas citronellolis]UXJ53558.1 hypothetical protein N5P21_04880 [Pseudomonas citronellolis]